MAGVTKKQKQVLDFISSQHEKHGYAPSLDEIAKKFGLASASTAHFHVNRLTEMGLLTKELHKPRSIGIAPASKAAQKPRPRTRPAKSLDDIVDKVFEGDCLNVMQSFPAKSVDMILCDLPYGTTQNHWDSVIPLDRLWQHYERILKDGGVVVLTGQGLFSAQLMLSNPKMFKYKIAWVKSKATNFLNAKKQPLRKHEDILVFYKKQPAYQPQMQPGEPYNKGVRKNQLTGSYGVFNPVHVWSEGSRYPSDVVYFKTAESEGPIYHPTQKPVELGRYLIRTYTRPGDVVLDNACGSGSWLVSAILEGRRFIGIEKNQEMYLHRKQRVDYIEVCNRRIAEARNIHPVQQKGLF